MPVGPLMGLRRTKNLLCVHVDWKGLDKTDYSLKQIEKVFYDVAQSFLKLLNRKNLGY